MKDLVLEYFIYHHQSFENELSFFRYHLNFDKVLEHAILSKGEKNKKFGHQRRIKEAVLNNTYERIVKDSSKILKAKTFEAIYEIIDKNKLPGFNQLCCYDSALRIAEYRKIPVKHVYLQAGSLKGAKKLCKIIGKRFIDKNLLPEPLSKMDEKTIEDFLCVMKKRL
jgi:hypothetical protein